MHTFKKSSIINCSVEELYDFHTNSANISKITPPNIKVEMLSDDLQTKVGLEIKIKTTQYFVSNIWHVKIIKVDTPNEIVDEAIKSPFKYWKHTHKFLKKGNKAELIDIIEYELPFGFLANLFSGLVYNQLQDMFDYRHQKTKEIFNQK